MKRVGVVVLQVLVFVGLLATAPLWILGLVVFVRRYDA